LSHVSIEGFHESVDFQIALLTRKFSHEISH